MALEASVIDTLLGAGTRYEGKLFFDGNVRIDGEFEGEVRSEGLLVIGEGAIVRGTVHVGTLIVRGGTVTADVEASELVELHAPCRVEGTIRTPALFVDKGATFDGATVMADARGELTTGSSPPGTRT